MFNNNGKLGVAYHSSVSEKKNSFCDLYETICVAKHTSETLLAQRRRLASTGIHGILFLTTNRLEEFDSAFQSRIHFGIEYTELDAARRTRGWKHLLSHRKVCSTWEDESFKWLGDDIPINAREIKNLIRTTLAITHRDGKFTEDAIRTVYNLNFKRRVRER